MKYNYQRRIGESLAKRVCPTCSFLLPDHTMAYLDSLKSSFLFHHLLSFIPDTHKRKKRAADDTPKEIILELVENCAESPTHDNISIIEKAAQYGHIESAVIIGESYLKGYKGKPKDIKKGMEWLEIAVNAGNARAAWIIGSYYLDDPKMKDSELCLKFIENAAIGGYAAAQFEMGLSAYYNKKLPEQERFQKALYWYEKAGQQGHAAALNNIGHIYECGIGVPRDCHKAFPYFQKAANEGNSVAKHNLAQMYLDNKGLPDTEEFQKLTDDQRTTEGIQLLLDAASQGYIFSELQLGKYHLGKNRQSMAYNWFLKAATNYEQSDPYCSYDHIRNEASFQLGTCCEQGIGCMPNLDQAIYWYEIAASANYAPAMQELARIQAQLKDKENELLGISSSSSTHNTVQEVD